jgi:2-dehydro-3-deoxyphosphogluconate aldolase/(4S)-4-hydroxy-2-oxoglutarate aldolase
MSSTFEAILTHPLIAILRGVPANAIATLGYHLVAGGITNIEVAFTDPDAADKVRLLKEQLSGGACIGAGTVTDTKRATAALNAGAEFFVTPHLCPEVNTFALEHSITVVGGALTPTEVAQADEQGCEFIKLFPASAVGPGYVQALKGPYPKLRVLVVGGITLDNLPDYLEAGAFGAGIGGDLTRVDWGEPDYHGVRQRARRYAKLIERRSSG